jgi:hypothetical protein
VAGKGKRSADEQLPAAKRARRAGGICLSDDEDGPSPSAVGAGNEEDQDQMPDDGASGAHTSTAQQDEAKPKPKSAVDDIFAEMKKDTSIKKAPAPKTDISSFINGLVSKSSGSSSTAAAKGGKFDVASLFPTSVSKKQTVKVCAEHPHLHVTLACDSISRVSARVRSTTSTLQQLASCCCAAP